MTTEEKKAYMKAWRETHKERLKELKKSWYQEHKEDQKSQMKAWYDAHKEERKAYMKAWQDAHKEEYKAWYQEHKAYLKAWYQDHKEGQKAAMKAWYQAQKQPLVYQYRDLDGDIVYIGKTVNLINRLNLRKSSSSTTPFDVIYREHPEDYTLEIVCYCETKEEAREIEKRLIKEVQPEFNIQDK